MINFFLSNIIIVLVITGMVAYASTHGICFLWDKFWTGMAGPFARCMERNTVWVALVVSFASSLATLWLLFNKLDA